MSFDFIANIFFPPVCVACRRRVRRGVICRRCFRSIGIRDAISCGQCLVRLPGAAGKSGDASATGSGATGKANIASDAIPSNASKLCHPDFPFLLGAAGRYENAALKALIHHLKFRAIRGAARPLALLIFRHVQRAKIDLTDFIIMPIPLSKKRLRARGYNQAELIARHFAVMMEKRRVALLVVTDVLIRPKHTDPQSATEDLAKRRENIRGAFVIKDSDAIRGKNVLLIDDVTTSGATFLEAALVLKAAGAGKIICLAAAKA